ncbi:MAG: FAD-dependent oxidoreductase [Cryobacterium sp.]|nr:FAD-dependent oxidoreductase [Cryobacterium sp.]
MAVFRVAIVGAGPAGIFVADLLRNSERSFEVSIDLFDQLPAPYGLVRYGVAPDHPRIKGIVNSLRQVIDDDEIRLLGNVCYGRDITLTDLKRHYHAVIFTTGATKDARLTIQGADLPGSFGAGSFVSWYDGHPDVPRDWSLNHKAVAVIGNGNVALDVTRMLARRVNELATTEMPKSILDQFERSQVTDIHVIGRRGPLQVKFTPLELRELGELPDVDILLDENDFVSDEASELAKATNKQTQIIDRVFTAWRSREPIGANRRIHFHFHSKPIEIFGANQVEGVRLERTEPDGEGGARGTGRTLDLPVDAVYSAIGYFGTELPDIPFDRLRGVIPNRAGRAIDDSDQRVHGVYASGWIKRGPVGLIGATKSDAIETVQSLLSDQADWWTPSDPSPDSVTSLLKDRGVKFTTLEGWHRLDEYEIGLGAREGRQRVKVIPREQMVEISNNV